MARSRLRPRCLIVALAHDSGSITCRCRSTLVLPVCVLREHLNHFTLIAVLATLHAVNLLFFTGEFVEHDIFEKHLFDVGFGILLLVGFKSLISVYFFGVIEALSRFRIGLLQCDILALLLAQRRGF